MIVTDATPLKPSVSLSSKTLVYELHLARSERSLEIFPSKITSLITRYTFGDSEEQGENQHNDWEG